MFWAAHVIAEQASGFPLPPPHTLGVPPPPQVPASQPPHCTTPPHLVSVAGPQLAPSCAQVEGHIVPPSPKLPMPSAVESGKPGVEESLPELLLLAESIEASFPNTVEPLWPPPQPGKRAAYAKQAPATSNAARFIGPPGVAGP
jgi:hypothetical protein